MRSDTYGPDSSITYSTTTTADVAPTDNGRKASTTQPACAMSRVTAYDIARRRFVGSLVATRSHSATIASRITT